MMIKFRWTEIIRDACFTLFLENNNKEIPVAKFAWLEVCPNFADSTTTFNLFKLELKPRDGNWVQRNFCCQEKKESSD
jgi:hypothetical protein